MRLLLAAALGCALSTPPLRPAAQTAAVPHDPDDPAIWIHPTDPARSLILGTDKIESTGGLYVFGLDGKLRQSITSLDRPNNVDVEYGFAVGGRLVDIAVLTERKRHRLRVFAIPADGGALSDLAPAGLPVLDGERGEASEPMGIALYKRPRDGAVFAIVAPKTGGATDYLWQYRLEADDAGRLRLTFVRRFGRFGRGGSSYGIGEIEAVVADDALGYLYYSDERYGIRKYHADPDHADASRELAAFGTDDYLGDREGLAIYATGDGTGFIASSDQVSRGTRVKLFKREGAPGNPHDHSSVRTLLTVSDGTDGLEATSRALPGFPRGLLVMMNARGRNFLLYDWQAIQPAIRGPLAADDPQAEHRTDLVTFGGLEANRDLVLAAQDVVGQRILDVEEARDAGLLERLLADPAALHENRERSRPALIAVVRRDESHRPAGLDR
jgi:3-phytase